MKENVCFGLKADPYLARNRYEKINGKN